MPLSVALSAAASAVAGFFTANKVFAFIIKAGILFGAGYLLRHKVDEPPEQPDQSRTETFASGPGRWVVGRQKVGGVIMFWGEDWDVKGTERRNEAKGGADDLHLLIAISEGDCEGIDAVWVGADRFNIKKKADGDYVRFGEGDIDPAINPDSDEYLEILQGLPLELDPEVNAYFHEGQNRWYESDSPGARLLDENNEEDAETIRRAHLAGAVSVWPYLAGNTTEERFKTLRRYTDDLKNEYLREGRNLNNPQRALPFADEWTTDHKLQGVACVHVRLRQWVKHKFDERVFSGGSPQIAFLVRGIRITYPDPKASTGMVTAWTENAAAVRYWWHTERRGFDAANIDRDAFVAAFDVCDAKIIPERPETWPDGRQPEWSKDDTIWGFSKYSINGVVSSDDTPAQIERDFDLQWQGQVVEEGGRLFYYPGVDRPVAGNVSGADCIEYPKIAPAPAVQDRVNAVTVAIGQSAYHNYEQYSISEVTDLEKQEDVDRNLYLPQDIGTLRWTVNPAYAYALAVINLRRARFSTTITLHLTPGDATDPVKYLKMSPGLVYLIDFPEEGIESRRMSLQQIQIQEDLTVVATFLDAPTGLYDSNYQLPEIIPRPPYTPSRPGALPPKPTNLQVTSTARSSSDGTTFFRIAASVDDHALRKVFTLQAGDDRWSATTPDPTHVFEVNVPRQIMEITVRHIDKTGELSLPIKEIFTPGYNDLILPTPRWKDAFFHGGTLRMTFEPEEFVAGVSGVEIRYVRQDLDDSSELITLTNATWLSAGELLTTKPVQIIQGQEIVLDALVHESGHYNLFARFVSNISGSSPIRGDISAAREIAIEVPVDAVVPFETSPDWNVTYHNLFKWDSKFGNTKGESLMFPAYAPSSEHLIPNGRSNDYLVFSNADYKKIPQHGSVRIDDNGGFTGLVEDTKYFVNKSYVQGTGYRVAFYATEDQAKAGGATGRRSLSAGSGTASNVRIELDLDSIPFDVWNGYVITSAVDFEPFARWPFGRAPGYNEAFDDDNRNAQTGLMTTANGGTSTWFMTQPIDLGSSKRVSVRAETYAYAPGTNAISNITFGGITLLNQSWKHNTAIIAFPLPVAVGSVGTVTYALTGLPAGMSFDPATRILSGTPSINDIQGVARYIAQDSLGGIVTLVFAWNVSDDLTAPGAITGLQLGSQGAGETNLPFTWTPDVRADYYEMQYRIGSGGTATTIRPVYRSSHIITGLTAATIYQVRVRGVNGAGAGSWSSWLSESTAALTVVPGAPTGLTLISANHQSVVLDWTPVAGASSYELRWKQSALSGYPVANIKTNLGASVGQISNLLAATLYKVQVRARSEAGASSWSQEVEVATVAASTIAPEVTITDHSYGPNEIRPFFRIATNELDGETGTDIEVTILRDPEDGGNARLPDLFAPAGTGPFQYFNGVGPGGTYLIRVRKVFEPPGGIGLIRYSAYYEETRTFDGVPAQPQPPRDVNNPVKATELQLRVTRSTTATRYRIRYWTTADPDAVLQVTTNDTGPGNTTFVYTLTGLQDETEYNLTVEAWNSNGWSLPSRVYTITLAKEFRTPGAITGLKAQPLSDRSLILGWTPHPDAESYQIERRNTPYLTQSGVTGTARLDGNLTYEFDGLEPDTLQRMRIRGYNSLAPFNAKYGPWTNFTQVRTPPSSTNTNPYPFRNIGFVCSRNATNPRNIDWTVTCPSAAGVTGVQVRYGQNYYGSDGKVSSWTIGYENIFNHTFTSDGSTFSGSFDPGYSNRLWEVNVRFLLDSSSTYDAGFTEWWHISNSEYWRLNPSAPLVLRTHVFANGAKPMTAPIPRIRQGVGPAGGSYEGDIQLHIDWIPNTEDFESPDVTDGTSRNELRLKYTSTARSNQLMDMSNLGLQFPTGGDKAYRPAVTGMSYSETQEFYTKASDFTFLRIRDVISIQPYYRNVRLKVGDSFSAQIVRHETGRTTVQSPEVSYTIVDPNSVASFDPDAVRLDSFAWMAEGRDVEITWGPVAGVDGYEVTLFENSLHGATPANDPGKVVQTSDVREWVKNGGLNEYFTIGVRTYRGSGNNRRYSSMTKYTYSHPSEVGKITGLRANVVGPDVQLIWNALPGDNDDFRYEMETSTDNGATWGTAATIPVAAWFEGQITHNLVGKATTETLLRLRAFKFAPDGTTRVYSTGYTTFRWNPTGTIAAGALNPINEIGAFSRDGGVHIDWKPPVANDEHPEPSRYRIQRRATQSANWVNYQTGIAATIDEWDIVANPSVSQFFRVRPETFEQNGPWVQIPFVADTSVTVGQANATASATYTTMTATWQPVENAQSYQAQYKPGTGGFSGAGGATGETITVDNIIGESFEAAGLDAGTHYQLRIRGVAGNSVGSYSDTVDIDTLVARQLAAPTGLTLSTTGTHLRMTWNPVTDATGYHIRIDAKLSTDTAYNQFRDVIVRNYPATSTSVEINRTEFGGTLTYEEIDIRVRIKSNFFDSPTSNYSLYSSVRWAPGQFIAPPGNQLTVVQSQNSVVTLVFPHLISGVNGSASLTGYPRGQGSFSPFFIRYSVATPGNYSFRMRFVGANNAVVQTQMRVYDANGTTQLAVANSDSDGYTLISLSVNSSFVYLVHYIVSGAAANPSDFTLQINGPPLAIVPLGLEIENGNSTEIREGGSRTINFRLNRNPEQNVSISISSSNSNVTINKTSVSFTSSNWNTLQSLTISTTVDPNTEDGVSAINFSGSGISETLLVTTIENTSAFLILNKVWLEFFGRSSYGFSERVEVRLSHAPGQGKSVVVTPTINQSGNTKQIHASPASITFTESNWNTGVDFTFTQGSQIITTEERGTIIFNASTDETSITWSPRTIHFTVESSIQNRLILSATQVEVREPSGTGLSFPAIVYARLNFRPPGTSVVTFRISSSNSSVATADPTTISFTNSTAYTEQYISVSGVSDNATTNRTATLSFTDTATSSPLPTENVAVNVIDTDGSPAIITSPSSQFIYDADGFTHHFSVGLASQPTSAVTLTLTSGNSKIIIHPTTITIQRFTWSRMYTISVRTPRDSDTSNETGNISITASGGNYNNVNKSLPVIGRDSDTVAVQATDTIVSGVSFRAFGAANFASGSQSGVASVNPSYFSIVPNRASLGSFNVGFYLKMNGTYRIKITETSPDHYQFDNLSIREYRSSSWGNWRSIYKNTGQDFWEYSNTGQTLLIAEVILGTEDRSNFIAPANVTIELTAPATNSPSGANQESANAQAAGAVAYGTGEGTAERVELSTETYAHVEQPALDPAVLPAFFGDFPVQCWLSGQAIDNWQIPPLGNGLPPYNISVTGLPTGIELDDDSRELQGTPTDSSPLGGTATFVATDANGNNDTRTMDWAIAGPTPSGWSEVQGGIGRMNNPFLMTCTTKGNIRGLLWTGGATNAHDIEEDQELARNFVVWFKCPTTYPHTARLFGAAKPDFDLVVKVGDDWYFSDTDDDMEMLSVPGHEDGALIGVYRYAASTTSAGSHNTGDPITLEWFPNVEHLPDEPAGASGSGASANQETGSNAAAHTPGQSVTDVYVLYRNATTGAWTRRASALNGWTAIGTNARQIRFEVHLKRWENRALRRFASFHRDEDT